MNEEEIEQERLEWSARIHELEQENERLKAENKELRKQIVTYHICCF